MNAYDIFKFVIGTLIILGFLATLGTMFFVEIPAANKMAIDIVLGTLGTLSVNIVTYLFGSSLGSKNKDEKLTELQNSINSTNNGNR